ncbi:MAG: hypothetical protein GC161_14570 [Planctomycetaceae bacterium]|nr:hypothetical protein [Planctomycetaceae bacterium]
MFGPWRRRRILDRIERGDLAFGDPELDDALQRDPVLAARVLERRNRDAALRAPDGAHPGFGGVHGAPAATGGSAGGLPQPAPGQPGAAAHFEGALHGPPPGARRKPRSRLATWISVALLVGAAAMFVGDIVAPPASEATAEPLARRILTDAPDSTTRLVLRLPEPRVDAFGTIAFDAPTRPGGWFRIEVRPADAAPETAPILLLERTEERAWTPTAPQLGSLPPAIQITVRAYDASGTEVESTTSRSEVDW